MAKDAPWGAVLRMIAVFGAPLSFPAASELAEVARLGQGRLLPKWILDQGLVVNMLLTSE